MDPTLTYCLLAGLGLVFLFVLVRFAFRWLIRIAIVGLILIVLGGAVWVFVKQSSPTPEAKPRSTSTRRGSTDRQ